MHNLEAFIEFKLVEFQVYLFYLTHVIDYYYELFSHLKLKKRTQLI